MVRHPQGGTSVSTKAPASNGRKGDISYRILTVFLRQEPRSEIGV